MNNNNNNNDIYPNAMVEFNSRFDSNIIPLYGYFIIKDISKNHIVLEYTNVFTYISETTTIPKKFYYEEKVYDTVVPFGDDLH